jgi:hypothetical protein
MRTRATIDDLYKVEGKAELVHGKVVEMPPSGDDPGFASLKIASRLLDYAEHRGQGRAIRSIQRSIAGARRRKRNQLCPGGGCL